MTHVVVFGNKTETLFLIKSLKSIGADVVLVTLHKDVVNKYKISGYEPLLIDYCNDNNVKCLTVKDYSLNESIEDIEIFKSAIVGFSCGWQRIIPNKVINYFQNGIFGWHGSMFMFPNGRGRSPINWTIRLGGKVIYHNCFKLNEMADSGDVFEIKKIKINKREYINDVIDKATDHIISSSHKIYSLLKDNKKIKLDKQITSVGLYFPKITDKDGEIFLKTMSRDEALNLIRSCSFPFPGAYIYEKDGYKKIIWKAKKIFLVFNKKNKNLLKLKDGYLLIQSYSIEKQ